ncbi:MAG TPA: prolyl oligopeptidase family serine peptidase [Steroidobacteraceae bacterium]|nr:prolyl oligopeptidase family serine peptidase [Steroidobacteraceae bacterium]
MRYRFSALITPFVALCANAQSFSAGPYINTPPDLVADGVPSIPVALTERTRPYLEYRVAIFRGWDAADRSMLISTRFGDTMQIHQVKSPRGARNQLSFESDPIAYASWDPNKADTLVVQKDADGNEFYQLYTLKEGRLRLLTDGHSRNLFNAWSKDGRLIAYSSTRRNGADGDLYVMDPRDPTTNRMVAQVEGGGWSITSFSYDGTHAAVIEYFSITKANLYVLDLNTGAMQPVGDQTRNVVYGDAQFAPDGNLWVTTDEASEFQQLGIVNLNTGRVTTKSPSTPWEVEAFDISRDGSFIAYSLNEAGSSKLRLLDVKSGKVRQVTGLPDGQIRGLSIAPWGDVGLSFSSARSATDAYSIDPKTLAVTRWTYSETGGLDASNNVEPDIIHVTAFSGERLTGILYRPDPRKFPGKRPLIVYLHGGPEAQARPGFLGRYNYLVNELGVAMLWPNVRGSSGYGKTFVNLDNGAFKRENAVRDVGTFLDAMFKDSSIDNSRVAIMGDSYGGYLCYASAIRYGNRLKAANCIVAISNFVTFLENTQSYRRDLRRAEYGDERDPKQRAKLLEISPLTSADKLRVPLFVVSGANDPRVPVSEANQMIEAVRSNGRLAWHLIGENEGHGFARKPNVDYQFWATLLFWQQTVLHEAGS